MKIVNTVKTYLVELNQAEYDKLQACLSQKHGIGKEFSLSETPQPGNIVNHSDIKPIEEDDTDEIPF